ncbi:MAG: hypothetical protein RL124_827 [Acidobacteriota bacterium]
MNQKVVCSKCGGRGILIDTDPTKPAIRCSCYQQRVASHTHLGIPPRYQSATLDNFWTWWTSEHPEAELLSQLDLANQLLMNPMSRGTLKNGLDLKLEHILQKSGYQPSNQGLGNAKNIRYALQPSGYDQLTGWASQGKSISDFGGFRELHKVDEVPLLPRPLRPVSLGRVNQVFLYPFEHSVKNLKMFIMIFDHLRTPISKVNVR